MTQGKLVAAWALASVLPVVVFVESFSLGALKGVCSPALVCVMAYAAIAAVADLRFRRIPNYVTYTAAGWGLLINAVFSGARTWQVPNADFHQLGCIGIAQSLGGFSVALAVMMVIYIVTGVGAGDVKLAAAIGAWIGIQASLQLIVYAYILAAVGTLCLLILEHGPTRMLLHARDLLWSFLFLRTAPRDEQSKNLYRTSVPLGLYFALATLLAIMDLPQRFGAP